MIGIIGAMEEEVQALRHAMKIQEDFLGMELCYEYE